MKTVTWLWLQGSYFYFLIKSSGDGKKILRD